MNQEQATLRPCFHPNLLDNYPLAVAALSGFRGSLCVEPTSAIELAVDAMLDNDYITLAILALKNAAYPDQLITVEPIDAGTAYTFCALHHRILEDLSLMEPSSGDAKLRILAEMSGETHMCRMKAVQYAFDLLEKSLKLH